MTAFTVKFYMYTIGTADFLHAFFPPSADGWKTGNGAVAIRI